VIKFYKTTAAKSKTVLELSCFLFEQQQNRFINYQFWQLLIYVIQHLDIHTNICVT